MARSDWRLECLKCGAPNGELPDFFDPNAFKCGGCKVGTLGVYRKEKFSPLTLILIVTCMFLLHIVSGRISSIEHRLDAIAPVGSSVAPVTSR